MGVFLRTLLVGAKSAILNRNMALWSLKFAVSQTSNTIDDDIVKLVEGAYNNDPQAIQEATERLVNAYRKR